ncbi:hypothetical protein D3C80_1067140 [compost metagenome]
MDVGVALCSPQGDRATFAMAQQPDRCVGQALLQQGYPGFYIGGVVVDGVLVRIGNRPGASAHTTLVDTQTGDAMFGQVLGKHLVGPGRET